MLYFISFTGSSTCRPNNITVPSCIFSAQVGMVPAEETSAVIPDLDEGKNYEFRVIPFNEAGPGATSDASPAVVTKAMRGLCSDGSKALNCVQCRVWPIGIFADF